jgi:hypothetical protein
MKFAANEQRTLSVQYILPTSMGLTTTRKEETWSSPSGPLDMEFMNIAMVEMVGYITSTGSSWAGNVEDATFTVITKPFESYLDVRGILEGRTEPTAREHDPLPIHHPVWFREVSPAGWTEIQSGIRWHYQQFKPQEPISLSYYMTQFPARAEDVPLFVRRFLQAQDSPPMMANPPQKKDGGGHPSSRAALLQLKEVLLATYGKEPHDPAVLKYATAQRWYKPRSSFSMEQLSPVQRAILQEIDDFITKEN